MAVTFRQPPPNHRGAPKAAKQPEIYPPSPNGPVPFSVARCDSDEYGQLNTVTQDGVTLGISAYNPSENCWQYPKVATGEMSNGTSLSVLEILGSVVFHGVRRINGLVLP